MKESLPWLCRLSAACLAAVVFANPDDIGDGFKLLRWLVFAAAAWRLYDGRKDLHSDWRKANAVALALVAVLFNPFDPFHFERETWVVIDVVAAAVLLAQDATEWMRKGGRKIRWTPVFWWTLSIAAIFACVFIPGVFLAASILMAAAYVGAMIVAGWRWLVECDGDKEAGRGIDRDLP